MEEFLNPESDMKPVENVDASYIQLAAEGADSYIEAGAVTEGYTMVIGEDGQQYVTIVQDNETYAIPIAEYQAMQQSGATAFTFQAAGSSSEEVPQIVVATAPVMTSSTTTPEAVAVETVQTLDPNQTTVQIASGTVSEMASTSSLTSPGSLKWVTSHAKSVTRPLSPEPVLAPDVDSRSFQPIRVDNWGIFLLGRLQAYFQKKEHCDLTIRFPTRNAQIKVHKLVVNACTDFFFQLEREGQLVDGAVDLPDNITPEAVAPIIRFMYTGRLDVKTGMFSKIHSTANLLQMSVLTKLMDAQLTAPLTDPRKRGLKRKRFEEDPVKQIKKIRRIERKFTEEERKAKIQAAKREAQKSELNETLPGKKLPIWKRKVPPEVAGSSLSSETSTTLATSTPKPSTKPSELATQKLTPISKPQSVNVGSNSIRPALEPENVPILLPPRNAEHSGNGGGHTKYETSSPRAYGKLKTDSEKPKIPRQIRELQENLTFEKIRRTGSRNNARPDVSEPTRDMTVEEIKEFMDEQRKRFATFGSDDDYDDDYFDNDAEIDYGDDPNDDEEMVPTSPSSALQSTSRIQQIMSSPSHQIQIIDTLSPSKPILKPSAERSGGSAPRKSVRFSLRPGAVNSSAKDERTSSTTSSTSTPLSAANKAAPSPTLTNSNAAPKKRGRPSATSTAAAKKENVSDSLDKTVDEFSRALQEEAQASLKSSSAKRIVIKTNESLSESSSQMQIVNDILKKNPDLLKDNKIVKLKVMSKNSQGKSVCKVITLRAQPTKSPSLPSTTSTPTTPTPTATTPSSKDVSITSALGFRDVPKVYYTGKRGRPKTLKPGQIDPHASERKNIEERLQKKIATFGASVVSAVTKNSSIIVDSAAASFSEIDSESATPKELNPSSEAEALSNVASGIAASLGLVAEAASVVASAEFQEMNESAVSTSTSAGPLSDLEHFDGQETVSETSATLLINYGSVDPNIEVPPLEVVEKKDLTALDAESTQKCENEHVSKKEVVSRLAMEWDDEEEAQNESA